MKKIIFWGTPTFAVPALRELAKLGLVSAVVTQPDKPSGRGRALVSGSPIKETALELALPVLQPEKLRTEGSEALQPFLPATFFVMAYGKMLPQSILDLSELPVVNLHPSLLPELRGPSPIQSALMRGDMETGITLMQLDAEMDHGPILVHVTTQK